MNITSEYRPCVERPANLGIIAGFFLGAAAGLLAGLIVATVFA